MKSFYFHLHDEEKEGRLKKTKQLEGGASSDKSAVLKVMGLAIHVIYLNVPESATTTH